MVTRPQCAVPRGVSVNASSAWIVREAGGTPTSTSFDMLARFQQKQLQEKEQKLLQLYDQQQQRAHQVAQRGSAGSNGSNGSSHGSGITNPAGKVRQMFDERRQNNGKGIDKSYPLEPLKKQTGGGGGGGKTSTKAGVASRRTTTTTTLSKRSDSGSTRDSYSRESYASSRGSSLYSKESIQRENLSRDTYRHDFNGFESSPAGQLNGFARNGQNYEINIDEVIDNEAMQRNRMLAKFQPDDLGKRRRFSGDTEIEEFPEEAAAHDAPDKASAEKPSAARKASLKNANSLAKPMARKPTIPAAANARQSTVMNTTKSASLKIKKIPQHLHKKFIVTRPYKKSASKKKPAPVSKKIQQQREDKAGNREEKVEEEVSEKSERTLERSISGDWESLKSTSLICKIIRSHSRVEQSGDLDALGKVNKIVTEIEGRTSETRRSTDTLSKSPERKSSDSGPSSSSKRPSIFDPETIEENAILQNIENEDKGDGLISQRGLEAKVSSTIRQGIRESSVEHPTDRQEITIADQSIKVERDTARRLSARRASFELKRMMFEQVQSEEKFSSRDSVESALRHFDSIGVDVIDLCERAAGANDKSEEADHSIVRLCSKDALKKDQAAKGFERHTSAWLIKTQQPKAPKEASPKRLFSRKLKKSPSTKLLEARDSIELARVSVKPKLQTACRRKGAAAERKQAETDDESRPVKSQSFPADSSRVARLKSVFSSEQTSKPESPPSSRTSEANPKRTDSLSRKNVAPYPSSKSPVDPPGEKSKAAVTKSTSLRGLNRAATGSSGDVATSANGLSTASRKSSVSAVADSDSAIDSTNKSPDDEKQTATTRTASPLSSSSTVIGSRGGSHPTSQPKPNVSKSRTSGGPPPTPAARPSIQAKTLAVHDDSLTTCKICNRNFTSERITLHEQICAKTGQKKRKQFDTLTHRIKGTELEAFVQKPFHGRKQKQASKPVPEPVEPPKSNWRRKHEDFINAIRSAKQMQVHLAAGGKISDLPPPPASDTSDYIQCPHCSRKFNRGAAERHIPKCETIQNKPKPRPAAKAKR